MKELQIKTALQISRSPQEVFEAVVDPKQMSNYFISESSGRMEEGRTLEWKFPEFGDSAEIKVVELIPQEYVSFLWEGAKNKKLLVEMTFLEMPNESTLLRITEGKMENDDAGVKWLGQNTEGWANFLACLKAYLEYGVNLRKGAFDFMSES